MTKEQQRTLEIALCGYLPYGVKTIFESAGGRMSDIEGIRFFREECYMIGGLTMNSVVGSGHKMILRPLSDLTTTITHNGESFIPIVELAKLFHPGRNEFKEFINIENYQEYGAKVDCYLDDDRYTEYSIICDSDLMGLVEYRVIEKLTEWLFDYRGLIDSGLAISVHDLPENPYL